MIDSTHLVSAVVVLASFVVGYRLGNKRTNKNTGENPESIAPSGKKEENIFSDYGGEYKMILVVRNDLKMGKGKIAAQCGHAAVGAYEGALTKTPSILRKWQRTGQAKIALKVESEQQLMEIYRTAKANNLNCCLIRDAGRTQIEPNSKTVLAVGPAPNEVFDMITGHLKLL
ncbi:probable peptidyl-tRNA hydrolase 2 [Topomyia yanbarensis]|uniref:probable peptidyl-tRNA hydrolase 2 n=1 Tax=Topomyia yanbarensis TaxID=2498891 RepID=UPI00273B19EB|nr:probable peptidyl-tRNA hydrolase 2 [Topomyia yanbarensis]XP_058813454.1 probable peptidyl-tRNA hydrolase 2 [Topomyia yanbarensis]